MEFHAKGLFECNKNKEFISFIDENFLSQRNKRGFNELGNLTVTCAWLSGCSLGTSQSRSLHHLCRLFGLRNVAKYIKELLQLFAHLLKLPLPQFISAVTVRNGMEVIDWQTR